MQAVIKQHNIRSFARIKGSAVGELLNFGRCFGQHLHGIAQRNLGNVDLGTQQTVCRCDASGKRLTVGHLRNTVFNDDSLTVCKTAENAVRAVGKTRTANGVGDKTGTVGTDESLNHLQKSLGKMTAVGNDFHGQII